MWVCLSIWMDTVLDREQISYLGFLTKGESVVLVVSMGEWREGYIL